MYPHETGRKTAENGVEQNFERLKVEPTIDVRCRYLWRPEVAADCWRFENPPTRAFAAGR
jgi:hypothetical protein